MTSYLNIQKKIAERLVDRNIDEEFASEFLVTSLYFSQLSYFKIPYISKRLHELGCINMSIYDKNGIQVFFAEFETFAVISFKGQEADHWQDLKTDFQFWKKERSGFKVHTGFLKSLSVVSRRLLIDLDELDQTKRILFTGHSLGGALAKLLAIEHKPTDICTFGSPRIGGGQKILDYYADINVLRVITENDFVADLPPKFIGYDDIGNTITIPGKAGRWDSHKLRTYLRSIIKNKEIITTCMDCEELNEKKEITDVKTKI